MQILSANISNRKWNTELTLTGVNFTRNWLLFLHREDGDRNDDDDDDDIGGSDGPEVIQVEGDIMMERTHQELSGVQEEEEDEEMNQFVDTLTEIHTMEEEEDELDYDM